MSSIHRPNQIEYF